ncbi:MAG: MFS transporter [Tepidisphaeraceae bacterium]
MSDTISAPISPATNSRRLLAAGFVAIVAAGVGFAIRGGILVDWGAQFGFTQTDLGRITGGGLVGFGMVVIIGAFFAEAIGYGRLMILALVCHLLSAVLTLAATPLYNGRVAADPIAAQNLAYQCLYWGMFLFAVGNGIAEAVVNPLTAALYPSQKTHYLNILHAGWPAGLVLGGLASALMAGKVRWEIQISLFLLPVVVYGVLCLGQYFPRSEARAKGVTLSRMLLEFASPLLLILLLAQALVGYVELGTDSWISNITGNILASPQQGLLLFVYVSVLMTALRFFAGPIIHRISPVGLLFASACFGAIGLLLLGKAVSALALVGAATVYTLGKTFLWPTMLGVVADRFPRGGAIVIGAVGAAGALSAGLLGGPGIGYQQDRFASAELRTTAPQVYEAYKAPTANSFLFFDEVRGLDGAKVNPIRKTPAAQRTADEKLVHNADLHGGRMALLATAVVPAMMALIYLGLLLYFKSIGGYRPLHVEEEPVPPRVAG